MLVHKCLQVMGYKFKDKIETTRVGLNDIQQLDDIRMVEFSQQGYLPNDITWDPSFGGRICERDSLDGDDISCAMFCTLVHDAISSLSN